MAVRDIADYLAVLRAAKDGVIEPRHGSDRLDRLWRCLVLEVEILKVFFDR